MARKKRSKTRTRRWPDYLKARLRSVRRRLGDRDLDALLLTHPVDIRYVSGFSGEDSWALLSSRDLTIISDHRFDQELSDHYGYARSVMRDGSLSEALGKLVRRKRIMRMGVQSEHLTLDARRAIAKQIGARRIKSTTNWMLEQRSIKDDRELKLIRKAISIQQKAFEQMLRKLKAGMTEQQVAALLEFNMRSLGADGPSFATIVAAGANGSIPHYRPGRTRVRKNQAVLIDFGALYQGYCSDMTRVVALGRMPRKIAEIYRIVREAHDAAIDAIAPGKQLKDIDDVARQIITDAGYGEQFRHGLGHGIGLEIHEEPRLSFRATGELKAGHVVTVEPGIYLPGVGGVRIEDDVLVTQRGHRKLSSLPTDLESAII